MICTSFSICKPELRASRSFSSLCFPVHAKLQEDCNSCTSQNSHIRLTHPCPSSRPLSCSQLGDSRTSHPCKLSQLTSQLLPLSFWSCMLVTICHRGTQGTHEEGGQHTPNAQESPRPLRLEGIRAGLGYTLCLLQCIAMSHPA